MDELLDGIRRVTFPLPLGIDHVHCYFLRAEDGSWTLVDTGLGIGDAEARWRPVLDALEGPVERIVITHFHPDHVGGAADVAALTGAEVFQGALDYRQCLRVWGGERQPERVAEYMRGHGMPEPEVAAARSEGDRLARHVRFARDPEPIEPGDRVAGWDVVAAPGHADGHLCPVRDGVLIAGDALLGAITPAIGLWPDCRPDPLGDYQETLRSLIALDLRVAFAGHGATIDDPSARSREILAHHEQRLDLTLAALDGETRSAYDVSIDLWGPLSPSDRRFALAETLAHLERLRLSGLAEVGADDRWTA